MTTFADAQREIDEAREALLAARYAVDVARDLRIQHPHMPYRNAYTAAANALGDAEKRVETAEQALATATPDSTETTDR